MESKMAILKIVSGVDDGGVFTSECNYISGFKQRGFKVDLVIVGKGDRVDDYSLIADNVLVLDSLSSNLSGGIVKILNEIVKIRKYGSENYRTVTSELAGPYHSIIYRRPMYMYLASRLSKTYGTRAFWHMPNVVGSRASQIFYTVFLKWNRIIPIANSIFTQQSLGLVCKHFVYPGYSEDRVILCDENYREELGIPESAAVYGMAGRICYDKAHDILVEAFIKSEAFKQGAHLILAGGFENEKYKNLILKKVENTINLQIHLVGRISNLPKFYSTIDVAINARRNAEPFGISIAEALGAGKPVIAYRIGGPEEMLIEGVNGWFVNEASVDGYLETLNRANRRKDQWNSMVTPLSKLQTLTTKHNVDKFIKIINQES